VVAEKDLVDLEQKLKTLLAMLPLFMEQKMFWCRTAIWTFMKKSFVMLNQSIQ
jgi:hypothetical protein